MEDRVTELKTGKGFSNMLVSDHAVHQPVKPSFKVENNLNKVLSKKLAEYLFFKEICNKYNIEKKKCPYQLSYLK